MNPDDHGDCAGSLCPVCGCCECTPLDRPDCGCTDPAGCMCPMLNRAHMEDA